MTDGKPTSRIEGADGSLHARLRAVAVEAPDGGFRASLHRRLVAEPVPRRPGWAERMGTWLRGRQAWLWPGAGLVAGAAAYAVLVAMRGNPLVLAPVPAEPVVTMPITTSVPVTAAGPVLPSFRVPAEKVALIKLAFTAEVAIEDVTFEVTLPEGLAFWSGGRRLAERSFRWPGRLEAGENLIPIAVRGDRPGRYPVVATVDVGGRVLEHRVMMEVAREGT